MALFIKQPNHFTKYFFDSRQLLFNYCERDTGLQKNKIAVSF